MKSSEAARLDFLAEALLINAARREHLNKVIWPALRRGEWVISDRFMDSTMAYQGIAQDLGEETIKALDHLVMGDFVPDLTFILLTPPEIGLKRRAKEGGADRYDKMELTFHKCVYKGFQKILTQNAKRCRAIDGTGSTQVVAGQLQKIVEGSMNA